MARGRCHALAETLAAFWIDLRYTDRRSHRCEDTSHQCRQRNSARTPSSTCTGPQQPALTESVRRVSTWPARGWRLLRCGSVCVSPRLAWIAEAAAYSPADRRWLPTRLPKRAKRQLTLPQKIRVPYSASTPPPPNSQRFQKNRGRPWRCRGDSSSAALENILSLWVPCAHQWEQIRQRTYSISRDPTSEVLAK
jgi:hypothetical protein